MSLQSLIVTLLTLICAVTDFRSGKIYNKITYPAALLGLALSFIISPPSPGMSVAGLVAAFFGFSLLYKIGGMGAGDVKLMAAIGALKGLPFVFFSTFYIFCIASLAGIMILAWKGRLIPVAKWIAVTLVSTIIPGQKTFRYEGEMTAMPFGPSIFLGTAFCVYLEAIYGPFTF